MLLYSYRFEMILQTLALNISGKSHEVFTLEKGRGVHHAKAKIVQSCKNQEGSIYRFPYGIQQEVPIL